MRLDWTIDAELDLAAIIDFIAETSVLNAADFNQRVKERVESLVDFSNSGKPGRVSGTRELISTHDTYSVVYEVQGEIVSILRIIHGGQNWPSDFE